MIGRALASLRLWKWIAIGTACLAGLSRLAYGVLSARAADRVYPGLTAVRHGCGLTRPLAIANAGYVEAVGRVAALSPIASALGVAAFAAFVIWARAAFAAGAVLAPHGTRLASPFEIVGMWVVPIIHLFMPFWYTRDLLRACDPRDLPAVDVQTLPPRGYRRPGVETTDAWRRPWLPFRAWWAIWVVSVSTYPAALYLAAATVTGGAELASLRFEVARAALGIASTIAFVIVVRAATEILEERARRLAAIDRA
jgi:Domain of unknown function (DUF4328)